MTKKGDKLISKIKFSAPSTNYHHAGDSLIQFHVGDLFVVRTFFTEEDLPIL